MIPGIRGAKICPNSRIARLIRPSEATGTAAALAFAPLRMPIARSASMHLRLFPGPTTTST